MPESNTESMTNQYTGRMPDLREGQVVHFRGEGSGRTPDRIFEQYLRASGNGYEVALRNSEDEWEYDRVEFSYSPNQRLYDTYRFVEPASWPGRN